MAVVAYLDHPLGEPNDSRADRGDEVANAMEWFRFIVMSTRWFVTCPWMTYLVAVDDVFHRARAARDVIEMISRSDVYIAVGGRLNTRMVVGLRHAQHLANGGIPVLDLTDLGSRPPWDRMDAVSRDIERLVAGFGIR